MRIFELLADVEGLDTSQRADGEVDARSPLEMAVTGPASINKRFRRHPTRTGPATLLPRNLSTVVGNARI